VPYFNQTISWANFWQKANSGPHKVLIFEQDDLKVYVYQYPLFGGFKFWYIPRALEFKNQTKLNQKLQILWQKIVLEAKQKRIVYIKSDWDKIVIENLGIKNIHDWLSQLQNWTPAFPITISKKKLQYLSTKLISVSKINSQNPIDFDAQQFWDDNKTYFDQNLDKRTRYGSRKSLEQGWNIDQNKNDDNFQKFYNLQAETAGRQHFSVHSREYLKTLWREEFSRVILLRDESGTVQAAWLGIFLNGSLTNLFGGNTLFSREKFGQYMLHLAALNLAKSLGALVYDLGGLEEGKGFDFFKKGYNGQEIEFLGAFDTVLDRPVFTFYHWLAAARKLINR